MVRKTLKANGITFSASLSLKKNSTAILGCLLPANLKQVG